jgi:hypothetical protein
MADFSAARYEYIPVINKKGRQPPSLLQCRLLLRVSIQFFGP